MSRPCIEYRDAKLTLDLTEASRDTADSVSPNNPSQIAPLHVDALWTLADQPVAMTLLAHGAGADMHHGNMLALADTLAHNGISSLRFNFPFMQAGKRRVDRPATASVAIAQAAQLVEAAAHSANLPWLLAGHSFGGRMSSHAVLDHRLACDGLMFFSFPLHQPKRPDRKRAAHLDKIGQPMLFLSGTRDDLADATWLSAVVDDLPQAQLHWLATGNHSYVPLKRTRQHPLTIFEEVGQAARHFVDQRILKQRPGSR